MLTDKPIFEAIFTGDIEAVLRILQEKGSEALIEQHENGTPLQFALGLVVTSSLRKEEPSDKLIKIITILIDFARQKNCFKEAAGQVINGNTLLHIAAFAGSIPVIELLLAAGMDVNIQEKNQRTPLLVAVETGKRRAVRFLLKRGANFWVSYNKQTIFDRAWKTGNKVICWELLCHAANIDDEDLAEGLAVRAEAAQARLAVALQKSNPANCQHVIICALRLKCKPVVEALVPLWLEHADKSQNKFGSRIAKLAAKNGWLHIVDQLLERKLVSDKILPELLEIAAESGQEETVIQLLSRYVRPKVHADQQFGPTCGALDAVVRAGMHKVVRDIIFYIPQEHKYAVVIKALSRAREILFDKDDIETLSAVLSVCPLLDAELLSIAVDAAEYGAPKCVQTILAFRLQLNRAEPFDYQTILMSAVCPRGNKLHTGHVKCALEILKIGFVTINDLNAECEDILLQENYHACFILCHLGVSPNALLHAFNQNFPPIVQLITTANNSGVAFSRKDVRQINEFLRKYAMPLQGGLLGCLKFLHQIGGSNWCGLQQVACTELQINGLQNLSVVLGNLLTLQVPDACQANWNKVIQSIQKIGVDLNAVVTTSMAPMPLTEQAMRAYLRGRPEHNWFDQLGVTIQNYLVGNIPWGLESLQLLHSHLHGGHYSVTQLIALHYLTIGLPLSLQFQQQQPSGEEDGSGTEDDDLDEGEDEDDEDAEPGVEGDGAV